MEHYHKIMFHNFTVKPEAAFVKLELSLNLGISLDKLICGLAQRLNLGPQVNKF